MKALYKCRVCGELLRFNEDMGSLNEAATKIIEIMKKGECDPRFWKFHSADDHLGIADLAGCREVQDETEEQ